MLLHGYGPGFTQLGNAAICATFFQTSRWTPACNDVEAVWRRTARPNRHVLKGISIQSWSVVRKRYCNTWSTLHISYIYDYICVYYTLTWSDMYIHVYWHVPMFEIGKWHAMGMVYLWSISVFFLCSRVLPSFTLLRHWNLNLLHGPHFYGKKNRWSSNILRTTKKHQISFGMFWHVHGFVLAMVFASKPKVFKNSTCIMVCLGSVASKLFQTNGFCDGGWGSG